MLENKISYKFLFFLLFGAYLYLIATGFKQFQLWPQVEHLRSLNVEVSLDLLYNHAHIMRYMVVLPIYHLSDIMGIHSNRLFTYLVPFMLLAMVFLLSRAVQNTGDLHNGWPFRLLLLATFAAVSFFMNGRLVFGLLAYCLLIYGLFRLIENRKNGRVLPALVLITPAIFLSSVSSGIAISLYLVLFGFLLLLFIVSTIEKSLLSMKYAFLYFTLIFIIYTPIVLLLAEKNISFYGGGVAGTMEMINHGVTATDVGLKGARMEKTPPPVPTVKLTSPVIEPNAKLEPKHSVVRAVLFDYLRTLKQYVSINSLLMLSFSVVLVLFALVYNVRLATELKTFLIAFSTGVLLLLSLFANSILMMALIPTMLILKLLTTAYQRQRISSGKHADCQSQ